MPGPSMASPACRTPRPGPAGLSSYGTERPEPNPIQPWPDRTLPMDLWTPGLFLGNLG